MKLGKDEPLTIEELKEMSGQPAYFVTDNLEEWVLINKVKNERISWRTLRSTMSNCDVGHVGKEMFFYRKQLYKNSR